MSEIMDEMLSEAKKLFHSDKSNDGYKDKYYSYTPFVGEAIQLGENLFQYSTCWIYKDGSIENNQCHIAWYDKGKLIPLETYKCWNYAGAPGGKLYKEIGSDFYASLSQRERQLGYQEYEFYTAEDGYISHITKNGIKTVKQDLSNLPEKDFLELYNYLSESRKYKDALKERTLDVCGKWGNPAELLPQRLKKYSNRWSDPSPEDRAQLIDLINNKNFRGIEINENRLSELKGVSINDIQHDGYSDVAISAAQAYGCSNLSGLLRVAADVPNTPAFDLISARYREKYGDEIVNGIIDRADEIVKLPYKGMFFESITKDNTNAPEANFLDEFTDRIRDLAMNKYGQEGWYRSISEAAKNPEFMKETDTVWKKMFEEVDKYATFRPNDNDNDYICQMFPEKVKQLHEYVTKEGKTGDFTKVLDEAIRYHQNVGKMQKAIKEYCTDNETYLNGNLHFDLVNAGIDSYKDAKRCLQIWEASNERPESYGSPHNKYYINEIAHIAKSDVMQDWMYPVMMDAVEKGGLTISEGRIPSEKTLFDCCKAWKINPAMPQRLAKFVGTHSLRGRMLAGAIFDKMCEEGKTAPQEWRDNKVLHEKFYEELARAEKMPRQQAFQQYIPNTPVNRKRMVGMGMEEKGIENTPENFKTLYGQMREKGIFEKMLAKPKEARTTISSRLLVDAARRKFDKSK